MPELVPAPDSVLHLPAVDLHPMDAGEGAPLTRWTELGPLFGEAAQSFGVWEMEPGVALDTEVDEVFVVISGACTIEFLDSGEEIDVSAGDLVRLAEGSRTRWTVTTTLRKLYLAP
ncbi:cupin domain-containing protein [Labedella endophytica]|uniref:DUF861 domain-containing protein n=1 Tax=Labedella endophytica TaxID=1523160 RepID=A0A3S0VIM8_9MICO|nr:cupin domain-containing protein [Labedella endophytica]RUR03441.1 DUF861 domain-containing protein [Labedella endophytica]